MSGIIFFRTGDMGRLREFYVSRIGMEVWLEQGDCIILRHENLLLGFCVREDVETCGIITFFYDERSEVDAMYREMREWASTEPAVNEKYRIYRFFAADPEGRTLEFQSFLHPVEPV